MRRMSIGFFGKKLERKNEGRYLLVGWLVGRGFWILRRDVNYK